MNGPYTPHERGLRDDDGGHAARVAIALDKAAAETRHLPERLMAHAVTAHFYAASGTAGQRRAEVDAWAARHHVKAELLPGAGYVARVYDGALTMLAVAVPVIVDLDAPAEREMTGAAA